MSDYWKIFISFSKIGAFTIGGGYAMIPLIQKEVVDRRKWIDTNEFIDYLAISQTAPGILAINISIFVGNKVKGRSGSIVAALGSALPSFIMILLIAMFFNSFKDNETIEKIFRGVRPAVVALILAPLIGMIKSCKLNIYTALIPIISTLIIILTPVSPAIIIIIGAIYGIITFKWIKR